MTSQNYTCNFTITKTDKEVFDAIRQISKWWTKDFKGHCEKINDEFIIQHEDIHYSKHKLIEVITDKKLVWLITESKLNWLTMDKHEWTNTKTIFELIHQDGKTILNFTHQGLTPEIECYERCSKGWDLVIKTNLYKFLTEGKELAV